RTRRIFAGCRREPSVHIPGLHGRRQHTRRGTRMSVYTLDVLRMLGIDQLALPDVGLATEIIDGRKTVTIMGHEAIGAHDEDGPVNLYRPLAVRLTVEHLEPAHQEWRMW